MKTLLTLLFSLLPFFLIAQCDTALYSYDYLSSYSPPCEDYEAFKGKYVHAQDAMAAAKYEEAIMYLEYTIGHCPCMTGKNIFIQAEKVYKVLEKKAIGSQKIKLQDKLLALYDLRIDYYGEKLKVLQKKGGVAYTFLMKRVDEEASIRTLDSLYTDIFNQSGVIIKRSNLLFYADIISRKRLRGVITSEEQEEKLSLLIHRVDTIIVLKKGLGEDITKWVDTRKAIYATLPICDLRKEDRRR